MNDIESKIKIKRNFEKKSLIILSVLIVLGIVTGIIVSNYYFNDANQSIEEWNENVNEWYEKWQNRSSWNNSWSNTSWTNNSWDNQTWSNETNDQNTSDWPSSHNASRYDPYLRTLTPDDVVLPSIACVFLCVVSYILLALNIVYLKIYFDTKSKYIQGLLFVLIPLLIFSCFMIRVVKSLYFSSALKFSFINNIFGFGISGLGALLIFLSIFEIIGLSILLHKSLE